MELTPRERKAEEAKGVVIVLVSAFFFAVSSAASKVATNMAAIPSLQVNYLRFIVGLAFIVPYALAKRMPLKPARLGAVLLRVFTNTAAIVLFYYGVTHTSVTKANMLNMTAPVFVFLLAPLLNRERPSAKGYLYLVIAMTGVVLVAFPDFSTVSAGDAVALASGLMAGIATSALREARKHDGTFLILFYFYLVSTLVCFLLALPSRVPLRGAPLAWVLLSGFLGVVGQFTLTWGMGLVDAATGSLVSASRILFAGLVGALFFGDLVDAKTLIGGILILGSLVGVSGFLERRRAGRAPLAPPSAE